MKARCALGLSMALWMTASGAQAASCCGGGGASALLMSKTQQWLVDAVLDLETYHGYWNQRGTHRADPPGASLHQQRLQLGYAHRLADRWQASVTLPWVRNDNTYPGVSTRNQGFGDTQLSLWYETFDAITCVWQVNSLADLRPSLYLGTALTLPTGESAYGRDTANSFEVTGRGFYRLDAQMVVEKTVWPWTVSAQASWGQYLERPVNREYGQPVAPYDKQLGDRRALSASLGYTHFLDTLDSLTFTLSVADLRESDVRINGQTDPDSALSKQSLGLSAAWATPDKRWVVRSSFVHAPRRDGWGRQFPATDILSLGVTYAGF